MTKIKPRYQKRVSVPRETLLSNATNEEVFTEFMKRAVEVMGGRPVCLFIDAIGAGERKQYVVHHASEEMPYVKPHKNFITTNEF